MKIKIVCPLGSECETAKDGFIQRCAWYTKIEGVSPSGKNINEYRCAMAWLPILQIENTGQSLGINQAICSLKEETIKRQEFAINRMNNKKLTGVE